MKKTKIIAAIIAGALTFGTMPVQLNTTTNQTNIIAVAAEKLTYADFEYSTYIDSEGEYAEITRYLGSDTTVVVPKTIKGIPVKSIGVAAFGGNDDVVGERRYAIDSVQKVTIPEGVITIKKWAFNRCKNLQSVSLPDSLQTIGLQAFWLCDSLESITIPKNASNTAGGAFMACRGLKKVVFSDGVTNISTNMFSTCQALNTVSIPDTVTSIGDNAFSGCTVLKEISIPDSVEELGEGCFSGCKSLADVKLSDNINSILKNTFYGCSSLKEITLPYYTSTIGKDTFYNTSLEVINIGTKLKSIDNLPIHLSTLKEINVSADNSYFSSETGILYNKDKSTLIRFPAALKQTEYKAPDTVVTISESAFADNSTIRNVYLYEKCSSVEPTAFQNCSHLDKIYFYNKNCDIYMSKDTIYEDAVINGYKNSTAEEYADMYGRAFNELPATTTTTTATTTTTTTTTTTAPYNELKLSTDKITLKSGEQYTISANQSNLTYSSNNKSVAIVSAKGVITALSDGEAIISVYNSNYDVAQLKVTVSSSASGDANGDGTFNVADLVALQNFLLGRTKTLGNWKEADLCKDGRLDVFDMVLLRKLLIEKTSDDYEFIIGDVNGDGIVNTIDSSMVLRHYNDIAYEKGEFLTERQKKAADIDLFYYYGKLADEKRTPLGNGLIDGLDASVIIKIYAEQSLENYSGQNVFPIGISEEQIISSTSKPKLSISKSDVLVADKNKEQKVTLSLSASDITWNSAGIMIHYDPRLKPARYSNGEVKYNNISYLTSVYMDIDEDKKLIFIAISDPTFYNYDGNLVNLYFKLPDDCDSGDIYNIDLVYSGNEIFTNYEETFENKTAQAYLFSKGLNNGYIKVG